MPSSTYVYFFAKGARTQGHVSSSFSVFLLSGLGSHNIDNCSLSFNVFVAARNPLHSRSVGVAAPTRQSGTHVNEALQIHLNDLRKFHNASFQLTLTARSERAFVYIAGFLTKLPRFTIDDA